MEKTGSFCKKELPLNLQPYPRSYAHHAFSNAIVTGAAASGKDNFVYRTVVNKFSILSHNYYQVHCEPVISIDSEGTKLRLKEVLRDDILFYDYLHVQGDGIFSVYIQHINMVNIASEAGILLCFTNPDPNDSEFLSGMFLAENKICSLLVEGARRKEITRHIYHHLPCWIRLVRRGDSVSLWFSENGISWSDFFQTELNLPKDVYIGAYYKPYSFTYYNWLYSNYIQMHCDPEMGSGQIMQDVELDFFTGFKTRGIYYYNNPYLFIENFDRYDLLKLISPRRFLINSIKDGYYIQALFNERYIPGRPQYGNKDFNHANLVYGYDTSREVYNIFGYSNNLTLSCSEIPFAELEKAICTGIPTKINEDYILRISPSSPENYYNINIVQIINFLEDYLYGRNSFNLCSFITKPLRRIFGINIYNCIIKYINNIWHNYRIFYSLVEHKNLMKKRIQYLYNLNYFSSLQYEYLIYQYDEIEKVTKKLLNNVLKSIMKNNSSQIIAGKERFCSLINCLRDKESEVLPQMISFLKKSL